MLPVMATSPQTSDHDREAADDGTPGNQSIPAMLRGIRSHLAEHVNILSGVRGSVESSLSTWPVVLPSHVYLTLCSRTAAEAGAASVACHRVN